MVNLDEYFEGDAVLARAVQKRADNMGAGLRIPALNWKRAGYSGGLVAPIILDGTSSRKILLKVTATETDEPARYKELMSTAPEFAKKYVPSLYLPLSLPVGDGRHMIFLNAADDYVPLDSFDLVDQCTMVADVVWILLTELNPKPHTELATVGGFLKAETAELFARDSPGLRWLNDRRLREQAAADDPLHLLSQLPEAARDVDLLVGRCHGDLHLGNLLARPVATGFSRYLFIDWERFESAGPLTRDILRLLLSVLVPEGVRLDAAGYGDVLIRHLIRPDTGTPALLFPAIAGMLESVHRAGSEYANGWRAEWRTQYLLSLIAEALTQISFDNRRERGWDWCYRLAASATRALLNKADDSPPGAAALTITGARAEQTPALSPLGTSMRPVAEPPTRASASAASAVPSPGPDEPAPVLPPTIATDPQRRYRPRYAVAGVIAALLLTGGAVWLHQTSRLGAPGSVPPTSPTVQRTTSHREEAGPPIHDGPYTHIHLLIRSSDTTDRSPAPETRVQEEFWRHDDLSGCQITTYTRNGKDKVDVEHFEPGGFPVSVPVPSTDPDLLEKQIDTRQPSMLGGTALLRGLAQIYEEHSPDPRQQAAARVVASRITTVTARIRQTDSRGKVGLAVSVDLPGEDGTSQRTTVLFAEDTGAVLHHELAIVSRQAGARVISATTILANERIARSGCPAR